MKKISDLLLTTLSKGAILNFVADEMSKHQAAEEKQMNLDK